MTTYLNHLTQNQKVNGQPESSVSTTSNAGSGFEELVPSRYALRVGEVDVLVISDGVLPLPTSTMSTNADPAARAAWFKDMHLGPDAFDWALNVLVVRSGDQIIPDESVRVRVRLMQEAAASGEWFVATHLPFPSVGRVAVDGDAFRWVAAFWDY